MAKSIDHKISFITEILLVCFSFIISYNETTAYTLQEIITKNLHSQHSFAIR